MKRRKKAISLLAEAGSILGGIVGIAAIFKFVLKLEINISVNLFLLFFYIAILIISRRKYGTYNFFLTTTLKYRFLFAVLFVAYIFWYNDNLLKAVVFLYLVYCSILSFWMSKSNYFDHRETRTIIDTAFVFLFCFIHGDPINLFYFVMFVPIAVSSRYYDNKGDMFVWITAIVSVYITAHIVYFEYFITPTPEGQVPITLSYLAEFFYLKVVLVYLVAFVYWAQKKKNKFENETIYKVLKILAQKNSKSTTVLELLCKELKIQLAMIIRLDKQKISIVNAYSYLYYKIDKKETDLNNVKVLSKVLHEVEDVGKVFEDYDESFRTELRSSNLIPEDTLTETINFHFLCTKILNIKSVKHNYKYYLLLLNKFTSKNNMKITKKFSSEEREIIERISHLLCNFSDID